MQQAFLSENIDPYITISQWCKDYMNIFGNDLTDNSKSIYWTTIRKIEKFFKNKKLVELTQIEAQQFINWIKESGSSLSTLRLRKTIFSIFINKAVELGIIQKNPFDFIKLPKQGRKKINPMNEEELMEFFRIAKDSKFYSLFKLLVLTGARIHEALALQWTDIANGKLYITKQFHRLKTDTNFYPPKNKSERIVPLPDEAVELLKQIKSEQKESSEKFNPQNLIFIDKNGRRIAYESVKYAFEKIVEKMNRNDMRIHDLRHTYAMLNLKSGNNPKMISESLGHTSVAFTLNIYAYTTDEMQKEQARTFQKFLNTMEF